MLTTYDILPDDTLVFIYQSDKNIPEEVTGSINQKIEAFIKDWTSHQIPVNGFGKVYHNRFIVLFGDEGDHGIGGCSKDKVTQFIREIENQFHLNLFDRMQVAYLDASSGVSTFPLDELSKKYDSGQLTTDTILFNNLVSNKKEWEAVWKQPLVFSPFSRYLIQKTN
jgi:hypothetical protein